MSVGATDRFSRSIRALLFSGITVLSPTGFVGFLGGRVIDRIGNLRQGRTSAAEVQQDDRQKEEQERADVPRCFGNFRMKQQDPHVQPFGESRDDAVRGADDDRRLLASVGSAGRIYGSPGPGGNSSRKFPPRNGPWTHPRTHGRRYPAGAPIRRSPPQLLQVLRGNPRCSVAEIVPGSGRNTSTNDPTPAPSPPLSPWRRCTDPGPLGVTPCADEDQRRIPQTEAA